MTSQTPGAVSAPISTQVKPDSELLRLCDLLGIGVVRVDAEATRTPSMRTAPHY